MSGIIGHWRTAARLRAAARKIAAKRNAAPATGWRAFCKLFVQERRDWHVAGAPRVGWKRGELFEVMMARTASDRAAEWGDVGYYIAQTWNVLWLLYVIVTPQNIIVRAAEKMERRAQEESGVKELVVVKW